MEYLNKELFPNNVNLDFVNSIKDDPNNADAIINKSISTGKWLTKYGYRIFQAAGLNAIYEGFGLINNIDLPSIPVHPGWVLIYTGVAFLTGVGLLNYGERQKKKQK